jgi:hypothetical protein
VAYVLEMVSEDVTGGAKTMDSYVELEHAQDAAEHLADWMSRKGIVGCTRVVCDAEVLYVATTGRDRGVSLEDEAERLTDPVPMSDLLGRAASALIKES